MVKEKTSRGYWYNTSRAKELRGKQTDAEKIIWERLRNKKLSGLKFRRQYPIYSFVVDFYCHEKKLVVELEGEIHNKKDQKEYDRVRKHMLETWGYKVLRFSNKDILEKLDDVIQRIENVARLKALTPNPSPRGRGE